MIKWIMASILLSSSLTPAWADDGLSSLKSEFENMLVAQEIPGAAMALVGPEGAIGKLCFGYADLEAAQKVIGETAFTLGSTSKMLIGVSMMQAAERGELKLDQHIADFIEFEIGAENGASMSFADLAQHHAGINDRSSFYNSTHTCHQDGDHPTALDNYLADYLSPGGAQFDPKANFVEPGQYHYSNIGSALAAYAVAKATNVPFDQLTEERFFKPLGMKNTHWHLRDFQAGELARPYYDAPLPDFMPNRPYSLATWPDGGLRSSISDFSTFMAMMINEGSFDGETLLDTKDFQQLYAGQIEGEEKTYGLFLEKFRLKGPLPERTSFWGHTGSDPGAVSFAIYNRDWKRGVVLLLNGEPDDDMANAFFAASFHLFELEDALKSAGNCD